MSILKPIIIGLFVFWLTSVMYYAGRKDGYKKGHDAGYERGYDYGYWLGSKCNGGDTE